MRMIVVDVDWVVDPPITLAVANNVNCTRGCQQGRGCEPGISKGAPGFRYWSEPAVNDLSDAKPRMTNAINGVRPGLDCGLPMLSPARDRSSHSTRRPRTKSPARKDPTMVTKVPVLVPILGSAYAFDLGSVTVDARHRITEDRTKVPVPSGPGRSDSPRGTLWAVAPQLTARRTVEDGIDWGRQPPPIEI